VTIVNIRHQSGFREDQLMIAVAPSEKSAPVPAKLEPSWRDG
jgi:hypothetical protein